MRFEPEWCSGVRWRVVVGLVRFDIYYRSAIDGIQAGDGKHVSLSFQEFSGGLADGVGPVRGAAGEKTDERAVRVVPGTDFQGQGFADQSIHPEKDNDVGEFIQIIERLRQVGLDFNAGYDVIPVVWRPGRFADLVPHGADGL